MKKLYKVLKVWDDLEGFYQKKLAIRKNSKDYSDLKYDRLDFLCEITRYTGSEDDITSFKAIFSSEIRDYSAKESNDYVNLISRVSEVLDILRDCKPVNGDKPLFKVDNDITIDELLLFVRKYYEMQHKEQLKVLAQMDIFKDSSGNVSDVNLVNDLKDNEKSGRNQDIDDNDNLENVHKPNVNTREALLNSDFNIFQPKVTCTCIDLFKAGKLSNYFESDNGEITYMCVKSISDDYVYIPDSQSFMNYIYYFSNLKSKPSDFQISVYFYLIKLYNDKKKKKAGVHFPYVFTKKEYTKKTQVSYFLYNVLFRRNKEVVNNVKGIKFKALNDKEFVCSKDISELQIKNNNIDYTVCLVE